MTTIRIELDTTDTARTTEIAEAIEGLLSIIPEQSVVVSYQEVRIESPAECGHNDQEIDNGGRVYCKDCGKVFVPDPPSYCVQVNHKYWYIAEPSEVGQVGMGDTVDVQGEHQGAHWQGEVTAWMSAEDYEDSEGGLPRLKVLGIE